MDQYTLLTRRQRQVLDLLSQGQRRKEIAAQLHISEHTLSKHTTRMFRRLGVKSRTQAVLKAVRP